MTTVWKKTNFTKFQQLPVFYASKIFFTSIFNEKLFGYHKIDVNDMKILSSQPYFVCIYIVDWWSSWAQIN